MYGNNKYMDINAKKIKSLLPAIAFTAVLIVMVCLSFLPAIRKPGGDASAAAYAMRTDEEALRVLGCCRVKTCTERFETTLSGTVKARVFGIPYTQNITGMRAVDCDDFTEKSESASAVAKAAVCREKNADGFFVSRGTYKKNKFVYSGKEKIDRETYVDRYGSPNTDLVKYDLDGAIISATALGNNRYRYVLDPHRATELSRNEVRSLLGGKSYPDYKSVEFILHCDGEYPTAVTVKEKFRVDKFGGVDCTLEYTEKFKFDLLPECETIAKI